MPSENNIPEKLPPQNIEAEKCTLGALMIDKEAIFKVIDFLRPEDFYKESHRKIYQAMLDLSQRSEPIDFLSVANRLQEKNQLEEVGGKSYLTELINSVPTAYNVLNYAQIVAKKKVLRDLIDASHQIALLGYNEEDDIDIILDKAEKQIFSITQRSITQKFLPIKEALGEAFERVDSLSKRESRFRGVPTGFRSLDNILSGLQKSDLIILASRPSLGKSSLALSIARNVAVKEEKPVGIFSLEMSKDQIVDRLIAAQSGVDLWKIRTGMLSEDDFLAIQNALGVLSEAPIFIDDVSSTTVLQMRAMARRLQAEHGLALIIIDYLQLIEARNSNLSMVQQVTENSRALKSLAKELNVPVLVLSQLSRAVEQRSPQIPRLSDLRESGSIEQDADVVMFIYREDRYNPSTPRKNIADIIVAKHRNGPLGKAELYFDEQVAAFREIEKGLEE